MNFKISRVLCVVAACAIGTMSVAQESNNRVATNTDWSVFTEDSPKECWAVSAPKETVNTKDGQTVAVRRGEILLMVFYRPGASVNGQVAFTGGYPFASGSTAEMDISGTKFQLFTEGEWAWPATPEDDAKIVAAMKRGADATLSARSGRGTRTADKFSLLGFTAAEEDAGKRCAG
jgi:hypothetical protein